MSRSHARLAIPAGPPPEVLVEVGEAWERAQEADGPLLLHFESEPQLARAWGALRTRDGRVVERVPAGTAVAIACGEADLWPPAMLTV